MTGDGDGNCSSVLLADTSCTPDCSKGTLRPGDGVSPNGWFLTYASVRMCGRDGRLTPSTKNVRCMLCTDEMCQHQGKCVATAEAPGWRCSCTEGWSGKSCDVEDPCMVEHPCLNGGNCTTSDTSSGYSCSCPLGYSGKNCTKVVTLWDTACCYSSSPCQDDGVAALCSRKFTTVELTTSLLVSVLCIVGYTWTFFKLMEMDMDVPIGLRVIVAISVCSLAAAIALVVLGQRLYGDAEFKWYWVACFSALAVIAEVGIALLWRSQRHRCARAHSTVGNRLWRGAGLPVLAVLAVFPAVAVFLIQKNAEGNALFIEHFWTAVSFGVLTPALPLTAVFARTYRESGRRWKLDRRVLRIWGTETRVDREPEPELKPEPDPVSPTALTEHQHEDHARDLPIASSEADPKETPPPAPEPAPEPHPEPAPQPIAFESRPASPERKMQPEPAPQPITSQSRPVSPGRKMDDASQPASPERLGLSGRVRGGEFSQFLITGNSDDVTSDPADAEPSSNVQAEQTKQGEPQEDMRKLLADCEVHRADLFLWAQSGYARLSALLPFAFWLGYMANELQVFLHGLRRQANDPTSQQVSVDGVRALGPVVVTLNIGAIVALFYAVFQFPAPETWSPFTFFGILWSVVVSGMVTVVTVALQWSLSEPHQHAVRRDDDARATLRSLMQRDSFTLLIQSQSRVKKAGEVITSWHGQTILSTVNHVSAIVLFTYGIFEFGPTMDQVPTQYISVRELLWIGVALSVLGLIVSGVSIVFRKWPRLKCTPTDDSFRLACVLKIALVITKSTIVFSLSQVNQKSDAQMTQTDRDFDRWQKFVFFVSFVSLLVLALFTISFAVRKVWNKRVLLVNAGVSKPRLFIVLYAVSFLGSKFATLFFMLQGHVPDLVGIFGGAECTLNSVQFAADHIQMSGPHLAQLVSSNAGNCSTCFTTQKDDGIYQDLCFQFHGNASLLEAPHYVCETSCQRLFFNGGDADHNDPSSGGWSSLIPQRPSLVVFVLMPLLWLPFAVYANNEVSQLIDGVWRGHSADVRTNTSVRIGLSTSADGYYVIAPLIHAVTVGCAGLIALFISTSGGYYVWIPDQLTEPISMRDPGKAAAQEVERKALLAALPKAQHVVTVGTTCLNLVMLVRVLVEIGSSVLSAEAGAAEDASMYSAIGGTSDSSVFAGTESLFLSAPPPLREALVGKESRGAVPAGARDRAAGGRRQRN